MSARIAEADLDKVPVREGIARLVRSFVTLGSKYAALAYGVMKEASDKKDLDRKILRPIRALIKRGVADGTLRDDIPAEVQFEILGSLLEKALDLILHKDLGLEQASSVITSLFLDGAASRPG